MRNDDSTVPLVDNTIINSVEPDIQRNRTILIKNGKISYAVYNWYDPGGGDLMAQETQEWYDDPKFNRLVDLAECNLKVDQIEKVSSLTLTDGTIIKAGQRDSHLLLIKLKGFAPNYGKVSLNPALFAVNFIHKDKLTLSLARAIGQRGKTPEGKDVDLFSNKPEESGNLIMKEPGWEIVIWICAEVPNAIDKFWIRIPTQLKEFVLNPVH